MVSPSLRQSSELFRKLQGYLAMLEPVPIRIEDTKLSLKLDNGSRVISLPGSEGTIRGFSSVSLIIIDEAARVGDDLYYSVRPMLAVSRGRMLALSTPFGKRGWFFHEWSDGALWQKHAVKALQCPRISKDFLEEERRSMPAAWFDAEYMCEFTEAVDSVFSYEQVMAAVAEDVEPLDLGGEE
ncbi:MAG: terminase family protein [Methanothrix sp.]